MSGKWETVVNKKKGTVTKSDVKKAQQKFIQGGESIPRIEQMDPIQLEKTLYEAGFNSDDEKPKVSSEQKTSTSSQATNSPRNVKKKEKKFKKVPQKISDIEIKLQQLDVNVIKTQIKEVKDKFPGSPLIWLKDVTTCLRSQLVECPSEKGDYALTMHEKGYPKTEVRKEVIDVLRKLVKSCEKNVCDSLFVSLLASVVSELQQGQCTLSYRLMIQILCEIHPSIVADNCNEVLSGKAKHADTFIGVMWALSLPVGSLKTRFSVWWSSMFSVLDKKNHAVAAMFFLRDILSLIRDEKITSSMLTCDQMIQLIETMCSEKSPLQHSPNLMEELNHFYPVLKRMLLTDEKNSKNIAESFEKILSSLKYRETLKERNLLCDLLVDCLSTSSQCMDWWMNNCLHYMKESSILLKYTKENLTLFNEKLRKNRTYKVKLPLLVACKTIVNKLDRANERGRFEKKAGFKELRRQCMSFIQLEENRPRERSLFWTMLRFVFVVFVLFVAVDLYKGYSKSKTKVFMKKYDLEDKALYSYDYVQNKTKMAYGYVSERAPIYYAKVSPYVDPVMEKTGFYARVAFNAIYKHSEPIRRFLNTNVPPLLEKCTHFLERQYEIISTYVINLYTTYSPFIKQNIQNFYNWLAVNIPKAYYYVINLLLQLKRMIYELHPQFFDQMQVHLSDFISYIIKNVPVLVEKTRVNLNLGFSTAQKWMQQQLQSASAK